MDEERIQIPVQPVATAPPAEAARAPAHEDRSHTQRDKDPVREIVETIVFVIVLVLLLKTFVAEAFVIPTGSMATTLLGHHIDVECPKCGHHFIVNASTDQGNDDSTLQSISGCECENCRYHFSLDDLRKALKITP